ncbi:MAG: hypothetical protein ND866_15960 [Pyrinomonadaceae bacterium]|nr:hypothetical protein [Pyrinomonadaceae bacterium]
MRRRSISPSALHAKFEPAWELYKLEEDYSQFSDLAAMMPDKVKDANPDGIP